MRPRQIVHIYIAATPRHGDGDGALTRRED